MLVPFVLLYASSCGMSLCLIVNINDVCRAYGRIGNAYNKQGKLAEAIEAYNKSLVEHRTPEVLKKVQEVGYFHFTTHQTNAIH